MNRSDRGSKSQPDSMSESYEEGKKTNCELLVTVQKGTVGALGSHSILAGPQEFLEKRRTLATGPSNQQSKTSCKELR
jgi:hypothetical protein